jgi:hypothetical protein
VFRFTSGESATTFDEWKLIGSGGGRSFRNGPGKNVNVRHRRIAIANERRVVPERSKQIGNRLPGAHIDKDVHAEAPAGTG